MAYDEYLAERITRALSDKQVTFIAKKMMGGLVFMVRDKMCCGIHIDKKYGDSLLMAKIGEAAYANEIQKEECLPMDFTGRPMKGFVFITPAGFDTEESLNYWLDLCLSYNQEA